MIGLQALDVAIRAGAIAPNPVLFRLTGLPDILRELYAAFGSAEIADLPWLDATPDHLFQGAAGFARIVDLRDFAFDPRFRAAPMVDFFLARLGLDPASVPGADRRNRWLAPRVRPLPPPGTAPGYALLCPRSSMKLRVMPGEIEQATRHWLEARGWSVLRQEPADSLEALCGQVAASGWVVSTDTAPVHLADAFSVPCLAFFPTHRPEWRVRDYPLCRPVHLPAPGLPDALEFARDAGDLAAARAAWFPQGHDLSWLDRALTSAEPAALRRA